MKKLKVLLTTPPDFNLEEFDRKQSKIRARNLYPPVQLATIAASTLKQVDDIEIEILDLDFEIRKDFLENEEGVLSAIDLLKNKIIDKMDDFQPDLVGISVSFSPAHNNTLPRVGSKRI